MIPVFWSIFPSYFPKGEVVRITFGLHIFSPFSLLLTLCSLILHVNLLGAINHTPCLCESDWTKPSLHTSTTVLQNSFLNFDESLGLVNFSFAATQYSFYRSSRSRGLPLPDRLALSKFSKTMCAFSGLSRHQTPQRILNI